MDFNVTSTYTETLNITATENQTTASPGYVPSQPQGQGSNARYASLIVVILLLAGVAALVFVTYTRWKRRILNKNVPLDIGAPVLISHAVPPPPTTSSPLQEDSPSTHTEVAHYMNFNPKPETTTTASPVQNNRPVCKPPVSSKPKETSNQSPNPGKTKPKPKPKPKELSRIIVSGEVNCPIVPKLKSPQDKTSIEGQSKDGHDDNGEASYQSLVKENTPCLSAEAPENYEQLPVKRMSSGAQYYNVSATDSPVQDDLYEDVEDRLYAN